MLLKPKEHLFSKNLKKGCKSKKIIHKGENRIT